jgi:Holliday junction resolvasome RuvABC endonuclease subunit
MAEMLLINPRKRRASAKRTRRATAKRKHNPLTIVSAHAPKRRRRNPIAAHRRIRRRRNPISLGVSRGDFIADIKAALVGASGAVAVDVLYGQINPHLPAALQTNSASVGVGDAVKAALTVVLGKVLSKSTGGMSRRLAQGALTVQAHGIISAYLPSSVTVAGMGYASPAKIVNGTNRVGPIRQGVNAYSAGNPLLNAYSSGNPVLSSRKNGAASREGVTIR